MIISGDTKNIMVLEFIINAVDMASKCFGLEKEAYIGLMSSNMGPKLTNYRVIIVPLQFQVRILIMTRGCFGPAGKPETNMHFNIPTYCDSS